ncbi:MAG: zinc ribbon domain-containing protein [Firmicutes bacterium]|nr:zinc ribbon domain-containing protein [Bacillota bacterium]
MKSVKPGRGPSMMNAAGSIFAVLFGIIWTVIALFSGAPFFFPLFGICFIGLAVVQAVYNLKNATGKNRYSAFDILDENEEADPLNLHFGKNQEQRYEIAETADTEGTVKFESKAGFCPYCGAKAESDFAFCRKCGKKLPE